MLIGRDCVEIAGKTTVEHSTAIIKFRSNPVPISRVINGNHDIYGQTKPIKIYYRSYLDYRHEPVNGRSTWDQSEVRNRWNDLDEKRRNAKWAKTTINVTVFFHTSYDIHTGVTKPRFLSHRVTKIRFLSPQLEFFRGWKSAVFFHTRCEKNPFSSTPCFFTTSILIY